MSIASAVGNRLRGQLSPRLRTLFPLATLHPPAIRLLPWSYFRRLSGFRSGPTSGGFAFFAISLSSISSASLKVPEQAYE
jgi:hypothetical protein